MHLDLGRLFFADAILFRRRVRRHFVPIFVHSSLPEVVFYLSLTCLFAQLTLLFFHDAFAALGRLVNIQSSPVGPRAFPPFSASSHDLPRSGLVFFSPPCRLQRTFGRQLMLTDAMYTRLPSWDPAQSLQIHALPVRRSFPHLCELPTCGVSVLSLPVRSWKFRFATKF